jgi:D-beta-D-heptose 7-phosphate kinase/D-beta-D-heptose 1-phosphate adenosyltransferase
MLNKKIKNLPALKRVVSGLKKKNKKIVFTNGCFDILHYGHAKYLQEAKAKGDILIVGINSDSSVREIKGKGRPIICEDDRIALIAALESVDYTLLFKEKTPLKLIESLKPDILVKGADWNKKDIVGANLVLGWGGKIYRINLSAGRSTTEIIKKIAASL